MVPFQMVVLDQLGHDEAKVALAERDDLQQAFGFDRADEPLRAGVRVRAARRLTASEAVRTMR